MLLNAADRRMQALCQHARPLLLILLVGAVVRLVLLGWFHGEPLYIDDEREYNMIAVNVVEQESFASVGGTPTSIRPPLYPAMVAMIYSVAGTENFTAVRAVQCLLGLLLVVAVYVLAERLYDRRVACVAAMVTSFYPPLLFAGNLILTEIVFALLLCCCCLLLHNYLQQRSVIYLLLLGLLLGLSALTRSVLWLFPPFLFVFLVLVSRGAMSWPKRLAVAAVPVLVFALTLTPWAVRNTRLQQTLTVVDVMGGRNFMMGNYEHTPMYRAWDAIGIQGTRSWHHVLRVAHPELYEMTQGQRDKLALRYGLRFAASHPWLTAQRTVSKFFAFWQLDRATIAGLARGYWGDLPKPAVLGLAALILTCYVSAAMLGVFGAVMRRPPHLATHVFLLLLIGFVWAVHSAVFAHSRYHLPLMPIVLIYASASWCDRQAIWQSRRSLSFCVSLAGCVVLALSWIWQAIAVDIPNLITL